MSKGTGKRKQVNKLQGYSIFLRQLGKRRVEIYLQNSSGNSKIEWSKLNGIGVVIIILWDYQKMEYGTW